MKLARDGIQLSFDIAGAGPPEFLFVHGLGGDRTHFTPQMEYFARQGRALTAELRGHGESDKPQQSYSIEGFAEDLRLALHPAADHKARHRGSKHGWQYGA